MSEKNDVMSDEDSDDEDSSENDVDLNSMFTIGQLVRCIILEERTIEKTKKSKESSKPTTIKKKQIIVSLKPSIINKQRLQNISANMNIYGSIAAEEDYGYIIHFGELKKSGFLKKGNVELLDSNKPLQIGQPIECIVSSSYKEKSATIPVTMKNFANNETLQTQLTIQSLCAGMLVSVKIINVVESGLIVRLLDFFNATIPLSQIGYSSKPLSDKYKKGKTIKARIFYINYDSKDIYMGCKQHLLHWKPYHFSTEIGTIFNDATIVKTINKYGIFVKLPTDPKQIAFVHVSFFYF